MIQVATEHTTTSKTSQNGGTSFIPPVVIQKKLEIGAPDDQYEIEADRMADMVVQMKPIDADKPKPTNTVIQRKCSNCEEEDERIRKKSLSEQITPLVQRKTTASGEGSVASSAISSKINSSKGGGRPLGKNILYAMESGFGTDFSNVRVHTDVNAVNLSRELNAQAFTVGNDIYFNEGKYNPNSHSGKHLLAHELTHTVQQGEMNQSSRRERIQRETSNTDEIDNINNHEPIDPLPPRIEPACPRVGTRMGYRTPSPPCLEIGNHIEGTIYRNFEFCRDSDIFADRSTPSQIQIFIQSQLSQTTFKIRTYSSNEGIGTDADQRLYNQNLACHRLKRTTRELLNAGVRRNRIEAISMGPTERFGQGLANRARNRVAVIQANPPNLTAGVNVNVGNRRTLNERIKNAAIAKIENGHYNIVADAYLSRWTCGRFRSLSEAVSKTSINIIESTTTLGDIGVSGINTINIPRWVFEETNDKIGSVASRIVDLTFHHFARPMLPYLTDQHDGGQHLVYLAGLPGCPLNPDPTRTHLMPRGGNPAPPEPIDPKLDHAPRCADQFLQGGIGNRRRQRGFSTPLSFQSPPLSVNTGSGNLSDFGSSRLSVYMFPSNRMHISGLITTLGDPSEIGNYEVGFLQTIMDENHTMTYVNGEIIRKSYPLPLRDGSNRRESDHDPPWYGPEAHTTATPNPVSIQMDDRPDIRAIKIFPDLSRTNFVARVGSPVREYVDIGTRGSGFTHQNQDNFVDRVNRKLFFNTWLVARHRSAPLTVDSTSFIQGVRMELEMNASFIERHRNLSNGGRGPSSYSGTGTFSLTSRPATENDKFSMRLRGPTPKDFESNQGAPLYGELLSSEEATNRTHARGLHNRQFQEEVNRIALPFRTNRQARARLTVQVKFDPNTGRVLLPLPNRLDSDNELDPLNIRDIIIIEGYANEPWAIDLAESIFPELRKLVAGPNIRHSGDNLFLGLDQINE